MTAKDLVLQIIDFNNTNTGNGKLEIKTNYPSENEIQLEFIKDGNPVFMVTNINQGQPNIGELMAYNTLFRNIINYTCDYMELWAKQYENLK